MYDWLDPIIEEQAAYYKMSVEEHSKFQKEMAEICGEYPND